MSFEIDPVRYGVLWQKVEDYEKKFESMEKKIDKLERNIEMLLELANKSKGGFFFGMAVVSGISGLVSFVTGWFANK